MIKILVVDDLPLNVEYLQEELEKLEYAVITASDGAEALQQIRQADPHLVLLDLSMPGMDGIEVLHTLRKDPDYQDLPVLMLTANSELEARISGFNAGADDYIIKPFHIEEVEARIKAHLRIQTLQQEILERQKHLARVEGVGQTLVTLSHHINNASQAMSGLAQLCQMEPDDLQQHHELAEITLKQTAKITAVLNSLQQMVNTMQIQTEDYAGDPNRMFNIEADLKKRLKNLENDAAET